MSLADDNYLLRKNVFEKFWLKHVYENHLKIQDIHSHFINSRMSINFSFVQFFLFFQFSLVFSTFQCFTRDTFSNISKHFKVLQVVHFITFPNIFKHFKVLQFLLQFCFCQDKNARIQEHCLWVCKCKLTNKENVFWKMEIYQY